MRYSQKKDLTHSMSNPCGATGMKRETMKKATLIACTLLIGTALSGKVQAQNASGDPNPNVENGNTRYPDHIGVVQITRQAWVNGPNQWGPWWQYLLKVYDNYGNAWGTGAPQESFGPVTYSTNAQLKAALQADGVPGTASTWTGGAFNNPGPGEFTDNHETMIRFDAGKNTFFYSFDQNWNQVQCPGSPWYLGTDHIQFYESYVNLH